MLPRFLQLGAAAVAILTAAEAAAQEVTSTTTTSAAAATHSIAVGAEGFKFSPNEITGASVGDIIEWRFYPTGHSVVRAAFEHPCIPYEYTGPNLVGFWSGFEPVATVSDNPPVFRVRVNDTEPIFFYCSAPGSCTDQHMIGVVNPNTTWTLGIQEQYAANASYQLSPGDPFPSETAAATPSSSPGAHHGGGGGGRSGGGGGGGLSGGAIAGIAIGAAAVLVLSGALIYLCGRRGGLDKAYRRGRFSAVDPGPAPMVEAQYAPAAPSSVGPKGPGQATAFAAEHGGGGDAAAYRLSMAGSSGPGYPPAAAVSPPLGSPGYAPYPSPGHQVHSPLMAGMDGTGTMVAPTYYMSQPSPPLQPPHQYQQPAAAAAYPVELPTSHDPGNSPLPSYSPPPREPSWARDLESGGRPGGGK